MTDNVYNEDAEEVYQEAPMTAADAGHEDVYGPSTVIAALDQIEDLVEAARSLPMSASVMVNKAEILDLLDQAREALPEDMVTADAVVADADALISRADEVAENTMAEANERAQALVDEARQQAQDITDHAHEDAAQVRDAAAREATDTATRAREEAQAMIEQARAEAQRLVSEQEVTVRAQEEAERIVRQAQDEAISLADGADQYCMESLETLQKALGRISQQTVAGHDAIAQRQAARYGEE